MGIIIPFGGYFRTFHRSDEYVAKIVFGKKLYLLIAFFVPTIPPSAHGQNPAPVELIGKATDFYFTRNYNSYYWREDFSFLLKDDKTERKGNQRLGVRVSARYVERGADRRATGSYTLAYRWQGGGLAGKGTGVFGLSPVGPLGYFSASKVGDVAATTHRHL